MGNIHVLDISVANLIAAGEVVDRPASAIKEMMENSIDAGATEITVEVRNGGSSFMRVTDNGYGMDADDAKSCVKRHATSKIRNQHDLDSIMTLGFRGEALAAIASVSNFRLLTRRPGEAMGWMLRCEAGEIVEFCPAGCPEGTTIIAESLFANIPARRKFLKKDVSETAAVVATVEKIALSHPEIAFRLITDGTLRFSTSGDGRLINAIYAVLGRDFAKKLTPVKDMTEGIGVEGYVSRPDNVRGNRNYQNFFINGRYIKSATASAALEQAFVSYCPSDKFPCCVLNLEIHPALVDVNVHPAKLEVKFSNEKMIFHAVYCAVRNALEQNIRSPESPTAPLVATSDDLKSLGDLIAYKAESAEAARQIALDRDALSVPYKQVSAFEANPAIPAQKKTRTVEIPEETPLPEIPSAAKSEPSLSAEARAQQTAYKNPFSRLSAPLEKTPSPLYEESFGSSKPVVSKTATVLPFSHNPEYEIPAGYDPFLQTLKKASSTETQPPSRPQKSEEFALDSPSDFGAGFSDELLSLSSNEQSLGEFVRDDEAIPSSAPKQTADPLPQYRLGGILFQCYVFVELEDRAILIDKHAAHERILFENLKANMEKTSPAFQLQLIPIPLSLSPTEAAAALEYRDELRAIGFEFAQAEHEGCPELTQIPSELDRTNAVDVFTTLVGHLAAGTGTAALSRKALYEKALFQASCKAAVKAGKEDDPEHIRWIVEQTLSRPDVRFCPHGRPVALELTKSQVEHMFHRP